MMKTLTDPQGNTIYYTGVGPEGGALPALFYFSLSGEESLSLSPYNTPAVLLEGAPLRVFSLTLPGHGPGFDKFHAMKYWVDHVDLLKHFFKKVVFTINWLIKEGVVDPAHVAVGGLSRGGFVATHIAALEKRIKTVLAFAPLTKLSALKEFTAEATHAKILAKTLDLEHLVGELTHLHYLRFYIGNRDERVGTDACYSFIRKLAERGTRPMHVELRITRSIGHQGHGTSPEVFEEGINWLKGIL